MAFAAVGVGAGDHVLHAEHDESALVHPVRRRVEHVAPDHLEIIRRTRRAPPSTSRTHRRLARAYRLPSRPCREAGRVLRTLVGIGQVRPSEIGGGGSFCRRRRTSPGMSTASTRSSASETRLAVRITVTARLIRPWAFASAARAGSSLRRFIQALLRRCVAALGGRLCPVDDPVEALDLRPGLGVQFPGLPPLRSAPDHDEEQRQVDETEQALRVDPMQPEKAAEEPENVGQRKVRPAGLGSVRGSRHERPGDEREQEQRSPEHPMGQGETNRGHDGSTRLERRCDRPAAPGGRPAWRQGSSFNPLVMSGVT